VKDNTLYLQHIADAWNVVEKDLPALADAVARPLEGLRR
jgi:hypothetical protein